MSFSADEFHTKRKEAKCFNKLKMNLIELYIILSNQYVLFDFNTILFLAYNDN